MDDIDRDILSEIEQDARISFLELGRRVSLSPNAAAERLRRLTRGTIKGFHAEIDPERMGYALQAFVEVKMRSETGAEAFQRLLEHTPGVVEWMLTTGAFDYMLRVVCAEQRDLVRLIESLRRSGLIAETQSRIILHRERRPLMESVRSGGP